MSVNFLDDFIVAPYFDDEPKHPSDIENNNSSNFDNLNDDYVIYDQTDTL